MSIIGVDSDREVAAAAGEVCTATGSTPDLLAGAEVVVLCSPLDTIPEWVGHCATTAPDAVVTDCGSTKVWIVEQARRVGGVRFLGGHPMAGREQGGWGLSDAELFAGSTWILTPEVEADMVGFEPWLAALTAIGAHIQVMSPAEHDRAVAWSSHLPLAVSSALVNAVAGSPEWPGAGWLTAGGFRDAARLAGGDPRLHASIATTNSAALGEAIDGLCTELAALRSVLDDEQAVRAYFERARDARNRWLSERAEAGRPVR
jgi:prephenate dehydrogenase